MIYIIYKRKNVIEKSINENTFQLIKFTVFRFFVDKYRNTTEINFIKKIILSKKNIEQKQNHLKYLQGQCKIVN